MNCLRGTNDSGSQCSPKNLWPHNEKAGAIERRDFLKGLALAGFIASASDSPSAEGSKQGVPYRTLGQPSCPFVDPARCDLLLPHQTVHLRKAPIKAPL